MKKFSRFLYNWSKTIVDPRALYSAIRAFPWYFSDALRYSRMPGVEKMSILDTHPCLADRTPSTPFDPHYFYQSNWAFRLIMQNRPQLHVDVGSDIGFVSHLAAVAKVMFIDIRPLESKISGLECRAGSILSIPFKDNGVRSLSSLHVAEHIGLGRYGDPLDPKGTAKSALELQRVLARGGDLYFSVPVGRPRLCFNAHRIHAPQTILGYFKELELVEFSGVDDAGKFLPACDPADLEGAEYACGMFHFKKLS